jgi:hypothetical protein
MNTSTGENRNYVIKIFFLIQFFVAVLKIDATAYSAIDYDEHPVLTQVVRVVSEGPHALPGYCKFLPSPENNIEVSFPVVDLSTLHKYALYYYSSCLQVHYKSIVSNFIPHAPLVRILQRKNSGDQAHDTAPLLLHFVQ